MVHIQLILDTHVVHLRQLPGFVLSCVAGTWLYRKLRDFCSSLCILFTRIVDDCVSCRVFTDVSRQLLLRRRHALPPVTSATCHRVRATHRRRVTTAIRNRKLAAEREVTRCCRRPISSRRWRALPVSSRVPVSATCRC